MKRHDRLILCGGVPGRRGIRAQRLRLDIWGRDPNVFLKIRNITDAMSRNPPPVLLDLLDVAAYLYAGDQAVPRGGTRSFDYGGRWDRRLRYVIPVRRPEVWDRADVKGALADTLGSMTDDRFEFWFPKYENPKKLPDYLEFDPNTPNPSGIEEVCLFSGGLDSLCGAVQEAVMDQRKVALVCHSPAPQLHSRQKRLLEVLNDKCQPDKRPFFVHVWANKASALTKDTSQRIRSFLYASLGAVVAGIFELDKIRFYENGPVSLNLPICEQLVGARVTRTTHPQTLAGMGKLIGLLLDTDFTVENPFLWKTRTDTVLDLKAAKAADLIPYTVSCSHTRGMTTGYPHCGCCSQCIDRRFAILAAGCGEHDPADSYELDVLVDERTKTEDRTMLERYIGFATKVDGIGDATSFFGEFPEAYRTLNALNGERQRAAEAVYQLCKRQAEQVNSVIDNTLAEHARTGEIRRGNLPDTCALMLIRDRRHIATTSQATPPESGDEADEQGFVTAPEDEKAYRPASEIVNKHWPIPPLRDVRNKNKELWKILDEHPEVWRWKPSENRLMVHLGRWLTYIENQQKIISQGLAAVAKKGHWMCKGCHTVFVDQPAQDKCPGCGSGAIEPVIGRLPK